MIGLDCERAVCWRIGTGVNYGRQQKHEQGAVRKYSLTYYLWTRFTVRARYRAIGTVPVPWPAPAVRESRTHIAHMLLPVA